MDQKSRLYEPNNGQERYLGRREFLNKCGKCLMMAAGMGVLGEKSEISDQFALMDFTSRAQRKRVRLHLIYALHGLKQDRPDWPNLGFDFRPVIENYDKVLRKKLPEFAFQTSLSSGPEETSRILEADQAEPPDGYVVFQLNCWNRVLQPILEVGKPVLYVDFQYGGSGGFLVYTADCLRQKRENFGFICSSDFNLIISALRAFEQYKGAENQTSFAELVRKVRVDQTPRPGYLKCYPDKLRVLPAEETVSLMKQSPILLFRDEKGGEPFEMAGIPVLNLPFSELNQAWKKADREEAKAVARVLGQKASLVRQVSWAELINSAAMYLGLRALLNKYQARAVTINCLGGFYGGYIQAYPCLGFHELNNQGLVGACEADLRSTVTMVAFSLMSHGRPGYISDPVIDLGRRQIIYAHCVASNKVFGPDGPANSFEILSHSEDRRGASVRSLMPAGYLTTSLQIDPAKKEILLHQAKTIGNSFEDRACRTKLVAEPLGDTEKLFTMWDRWGWHRVTFYGDLKKPAYELAEVLGYRVTEEA